MSQAGQQMERRYVHGVYDIIAGHFSATRFAVWPKVSLHLQYFLLQVHILWRSERALVLQVVGQFVQGEPLLTHTFLTI